MLSQLEIYLEKFPVTKGPISLDELYWLLIRVFIPGGIAMVPPILNHQKKVERPKGMLRLELSKFLESTELPWPKNVPLALFTVGSTPNGNHKLTPYEIFTGRLMSLMVQPHIDMSLIYPEMIQYCKSLIYYTKVYFQQVEEAVPNPDSINFLPRNLKLRSHGRDIKNIICLCTSSRDSIKCSSSPTQQPGFRAWDPGSTSLK